MKRLLVLAFLTSMSLTGCLAGQKTGSLDTLSADHAGDARALAELAATELAERHAPAHTALRLERAPGAFGETLEAELRRAGFALVPDGGLGISYTLDVLRDQGQPLGYARISSTDGQLFSISRKLSDTPVTYTEPPSAQAPSSTLEARPLPDPVSSPGVDPAGQTALPVAESPAKAATTPPAGAGNVKTVPVSRTATAAAVARRSGVPVDDFCRWNNVGPNAMLIEGYQVYLSEPPAGTIPVAAENPVPAGVAAGTPGATLPAPVPASTTLPAHTSAKLSLSSATPQKAETKTISYTPVAAPVTPPAPPAPVAEGPRVSPVPSPVPTSTPSGDTAAVPASLPADAEIIPVSNPAGMGGVRSWEIVKGEMLKAQLERWATDAGYTLIWSAHNDYEMQSNSTFNGSFQAAVKAFFGALQSNGHALRVTIFEGNSVVEVSEH
ncbi:TcpQ domain-containing protein [uncultured Desulfovibrio sp.]|uniref:TcpQ domain-containing protein n=1 Tax=uncultured Desulfovibrio sp. TaxID=167968 RepID=UPI002604DBF7|nr:TcpQ domain-containing protein [uncultured Desulfovibrio sp.]